ncbi:MAG: hypothetical protein ACHQIG_04475, partial [Acidimicrobiia bacterium]
MPKLVGVVVLVALAAGALSACAPPPPEPLPPTNTSSGLPVDSTWKLFIDGTRELPGYPDFFGGHGRDLWTRVWYPAVRDQAPYPLVIFAHGFGVGPDDYAPLLARIASAGYVVAAPLYPVLSGWPYGPSDVDDWDQKLPDTWFVTDSMIDLGNSGDPTFGGLIDPARIAVAGHSDGAVIAFEDGFGEGLEDGRVRAVAAYSAGLDGLGYQPNGRSLLHFLSEND